MWCRHLDNSRSNYYQSHDQKWWAKETVRTHDYPSHKKCVCIRVFKHALLALFVLLLSTNALAETAYVGDTLRVGVRAEPGTRSPSLTVITSGTQVEVLEQKSGHSLVRTPNGVEGWVKSAYISSDTPSAVRLRQAKRTINDLEKQIDKLTRMQPGQSIQNNALSENIMRLEDERKTLQNELEKLQQEVENGPRGSSKSLDIESFDTALWVFGFTVFVLSLGFLFGVTWHKTQVTKRLGGLSL